MVLPAGRGVGGQRRGGCSPGIGPGLSAFPVGRGDGRRFGADLHHLLELHGHLHRAAGVCRIGQGHALDRHVPVYTPEGGKRDQLPLLIQALQLPCDLFHPAPASPVTPVEGHGGGGEHRGDVDRHRLYDDGIPHRIAVLHRVFRRLCFIVAPIRDERIKFDIVDACRLRLLCHTLSPPGSKRTGHLRGGIFCGFSHGFGSLGLGGAVAAMELVTDVVGLVDVCGPVPASHS